MKPRSGGLHPWEFWTVNALAGVTLVLLVINIALHLGNRSIQAEVNARQQYIEQTMRLSRLNNQLIQALANLSVQTNDQEIRNLLAAQGVIFSVNQPSEQSTPTATEGESSP